MNSDFNLAEDEQSEIVKIGEEENEGHTDCLIGLLWRVECIRRDRFRG